MPKLKNNIPNNQCPNCYFIHEETLPVKCKNCGRELQKNLSILMDAVAKSHISCEKVKNWIKQSIEGGEK